MDIFGIGPFEVLLILLIGLLVLGPNEMSRFARQVGGWIYRLRQSETWKILRQTGQQLLTLPKQIVEEAGVQEVQEELRRAGSLDEPENTIGALAASGSKPRPPAAHNPLAAWGGELDAETASETGAQAETPRKDYLAAWANPPADSTGLSGALVRPAKAASPAEESAPAEE